MNVEVENCNDDNVLATLSFHVYSKMLLQAKNEVWAKENLVC